MKRFLTSCHWGTFVFYLSILFLSACESPYLGEPAVDEDANVIIHITGFEQIPFDSEEGKNTANMTRSEDVKQVCSHLNFVLFSGENKVKSVAQKLGDLEFGSVGFKLAEGTYTLAVIGHNSEASATVTSADKTTFKDNRVTDTFLYTGELVVADQPIELELELRRVVAMFRFVLEDEMPAEVSQMQFYYTGGSSTLSVATGYGSVNSRQTVKFNVVPEQKQFDLYTFPHAESGVLKMKITALDANGEIIEERTLEEVPVTRNLITRYSGKFFSASSADSPGVSFVLKADTKWDGEATFQF